MRQPGIAAANRTEIVTVLSVSPLAPDHTLLESIIRHSRWSLFKADTLASAISILLRQEISVVLCERELQPGRWTDILDHLRDLEHPPALIVTSRLADERLWAEALNLGAWDVLAKPFDQREVIRGIKVAWQHRRDRMRIPLQAMSVAS
jgi:DNA-binding response OmpR family regulator